METIIIFRIGSIGDTVVALPCFHQVARKFPNSRRILITDKPASPKAASVESVLGKGGLIDGAIYFRPPPRKIQDVMELRAQIRETKANTLIYIADRNIFGTLRDYSFFRLCGIQNVIGMPVQRDLRRPRVDPETGIVEYEAERLARCLAPLGPIDVSDRELWDLRLHPGETAVADHGLAPLGGRSFVAINAGGKVQTKDWGNGNWMALLRLMSVRHSSLSLVFIGSADEYDRSAELAAVWPGLTLNLCGRFTPRESAAVMKQAVVFVGHDSGPMHLAAATGVPCVVLFGDYNKPKWWHPMGPGHHIIHNMHGVSKIKPEEVYAGVCSIIANTPAQVKAAIINIVPDSRPRRAQ